MPLLYKRNDALKKETQFFYYCTKKWQKWWRKYALLVHFHICTYLKHVKGSIKRDFRPPCFFHDSYPSRPLINRLKYFRIWFWFRWDIQIFKKRCGVHPTESQTPRCASKGVVKCQKFLKNLCGVHHTEESSSAVCIIPQSQAPLCASHRGVKLHTEESESKISRISGCFWRENQEKSF